MSAIRETVLLYFPQKTPYLSNLKAILIQMGVRIRTVEPSQVTQKVGYLAGLDGYASSPVPETLPSISQEVMVMKYFTGGRMDQLFAAMRKKHIPPIPLKAVVTDTNASWTFFELYMEIKKEHVKLSSKKP